MSQPASRPVRRLLGKAHSWSERVRVFWTDEALEVDQADNYEIRRRRVFFDEILLVTLHSTRGGVLPWVLALLAVPCGLFALAFTGEEADAGRVFLVMAIVLGALAAIAALLPVWVVTAFGRRTRARMNFRLREGRARAVYAEICRAAGETQRALAERLAAEAPPASAASAGFGDAGPVSLGIEGIGPAASRGEEAQQGDQQQRGDAEAPLPGGMDG